jgi:hypothetical protein
MNKKPGRDRVNLWAALLLLSAESPPVPGDARGLFFFGVLVLGTGLVSLIYPRFFWIIGIGRKAKIPPPPMYLTMLRLGGVLACALAVAMLLKASQF